MQDNENIKKLLIITGPQGSGNHLWSKMFSMHPNVVGWPMFRKEWQGHHKEPFNEYWQQPEKLQEFDIDFMSLLQRQGTTCTKVRRIYRRSKEKV